MMIPALKRWLTRYRLVMLALAVLLVVGVLAALVLGRFFPWSRGRSMQGHTNPVFSEASGESAESRAAGIEAGSRLNIRLSPGQPEPQAAAPVPLATGEPLPEAEIERILQRLPQLEMEAEDQVELKLPEEALPPPRTGATITEPFPPPPETAPPLVIEAGPLEVLRYAPEGEIPLAPFINITFNQPMVPLATVEALSARQAPVQLEPALPGTWRWLGTKTLTFQYDSELIDRLPMATEYHVTIPAGTQSAIGGVLAEAVEFAFRTPAPKVISTYPDDQPQPLEPVFFVAFDQRIDPAAVLETIQVTAGSAPVELELATEAEAQVDEQVKRLIKNTPEGRWLAFRAQKPLPADTRISVSVGPGTPSAEGPLVTTAGQHYSFSTYAPLRIQEHGCSWSRDRCPPLTPFYIRFNNRLDVDFYAENMLRIEPELPGASVDIFGNRLNIRGATQGQTTYRVTVDKDIRDVFGQTLGEDAALTFRVGPAEPLLLGPEKIFVTLDPASSKPVFSVYTINYSKLDVKIYAVQPSDWPAFKRYLQEFQRTDNPGQPPGRLVRDETLNLEAPADTLTETGLDLSPVMDGDYGHFIVIVEPPRGLLPSARDRYWQTVQAWVQRNGCLGQRINRWRPSGWGYHPGWPGGVADRHDRRGDRQVCPSGGRRRLPGSAPGRRYGPVAPFYVLLGRGCLASPDGQR